MKIYTKTGDKGETSLVDGKRVPKSHPRVEAYGTVDELNSNLGLHLADLKLLPEKSSLKSHIDLIHKIQNTLFDVGSHLACETDSVREHLPKLSDDVIAEMENLIDEASNQLPPLKEFILPGGHRLSAGLHIARTVCRRAERRVIDLPQGSAHSAFSIKFLNRLSDYLFVLARLINHVTGSPEMKWQK